MVAGGVSTAAALPGHVVSALKIAGPVFFLGIQGSLVKTAIKINKEKSVGSLSIIPFLSLLANCVIWGYYAILKSDMTLLIPSAIGVLNALFCIYAYDKNSSAVNKKTIYNLNTALLLLTTLLFHLKKSDMIGYLGVGISIALMGSPLASLKGVLETKSTESMPFATSLLSFLNAVSWLLYGKLVANDVLVYAPNVLGVGLTLFQLSLFFRFGIGSPDQKLSRQAKMM
jgi:uncharacterized protein with PQ loop repeat